ncbi:MAG TPA: hypothetical protein VES89_09040 [Candidatus Competibacteraceae bacterium]|nr:hypothetical protein [Candidatus Competibacteraceae bacterium]
MSGVNLDALSEEQLDALIAGCRVLRTLRAPYLDDKVKENQAQPAIELDTVESTDQAVMPLQTGDPE